jgi:hypothetical protein
VIDDVLRGAAGALRNVRRIDVVERVPGSRSTDFWGIARVDDPVGIP